MSTLPLATVRRHPVLRLVALGALGFAGALPFLVPMISAALEAKHAHAPLVVVVAAQAAQVLVLVALAAWAGVALQRRTGLRAPWLLEGERPRHVVEALLVGTLATGLTLAVLYALKPLVPAALWPHGEHGSFLRGASSAFYGGIVEELLMRWGLLAVLLAATRNFWVANVASALLFGAGHLPAAAALGIPLTPAVLAHVIAGNAVAGIFFGWIFRRRGLECAMIAHAAADVWLHAALPAFG